MTMTTMMSSSLFSLLQRRHRQWRHPNRCPPPPNTLVGTPHIDRTQSSNMASMPSTPPMGSATPDDGKVAVTITQTTCQMTHRRYVVPPHPYLHQHLHL